MRGGITFLSSAALSLALASCETEDPTQLRSGSPLRRRTNNAPAVTATGSSDAEKCFKIVNEYRAQRGVPALERWSAGERCADGEAQSDAKSGKAHGAFPSCEQLAQNECPAYPGSLEEGLPECLADMWAEGPGGGHYENMASRKYTEVACGFHELPNGDFWSVQNFR
ncbi:MAG: CAP domain-containing protein [Labilithrix sp.]|nr:CAP domain-containing protein [Labilithrix sp.]MCW5809889.1 CAP domain-containing protein [Labilithrix sp.]